MKQEIVGICVLCGLLLAGCTNLSADGQSARLSNPAAQRASGPEARFQQYGPFVFLGKYRIRHEWVHEDPYGNHYCHGYDSVRERVIDELGEKRPALMGMDMWESEDKLLQRSPYFNAIDVMDMTRFVIGKYRPNAPGVPRYAHEHMCRTYFEPLANEYELWLKKSSLDAMQFEDQNNVATRWNYARLLKPIAYEAIRFANIPAQRVT